MDDPGSPSLQAICSLESGGGSHVHSHRERYQVRVWYQTGTPKHSERNWGFRLEVEYLPMVMHADLQPVVCTVGCVVVLGGGVMNQFQVTVGPTFRF